MKKLMSLLAAGWLPLVGYISGFLVLVSLLFYRLGTLVGGISASELQAKAAASSLSAIIKNPINAPYKLLQFVAVDRLHLHHLGLRAISAVIGFGLTWLFYRLLCRWYTNRIATLGTIMFATSGALLHVARLATPEVMLSASLVLVWAGLHMRAKGHFTLAILTVTVISLVLLYTPGFLVFIIGAIIWQRKALLKDVHGLPWVVWVFLAPFVALCLAPLVWGIVQQPMLAKTLLGLPNHWPGLVQLGKNLISIPKHLFWSSNLPPELWLGHIPLLDMFTGVMFILGMYATIYRIRLDRNKLLIGLLIGGGVFVTIGGPVSYFFMLPIIYLVAAAGVALMLQQWLTVFPRNPAAQGIGSGIIVGAVLLVCSYNMQHYFRAWPYTPVTRQVFSSKD